MRPLRLVLAAVMLLAVDRSFAQEWSTYTNRVDRFEVNLPGQPRGSTIGVRCHQLRDGSSGCLLGFITLEGGVEKMFD